MTDPKKEWTKEHEAAVFEEFWTWKQELETDIGEADEDWGPWWECFLAGYKAAATY